MFTLFPLYIEPSLHTFANSNLAADQKDVLGRTPFWFTLGGHFIFHFQFELLESEPAKIAVIMPLTAKAKP